LHPLVSLIRADFFADTGGNENWFHEAVAAADLQTAMAWSASHPPADADLDELLTRLGCDEA